MPAVGSTAGAAAQAGPVNMGPAINSPARDAEPTFSAGRTMYFNCFDRRGRVGGDICVSTLADGAWSDPEIVEAVSTDEYTEVEPLRSPDGRSLYVSAVRADGHGGEDIHVTTRGADGVWGPLVNLGPLVNSDRDDRCPAFSPDYSVFYFDSERDGGYGNEDLWLVPYAAVRDTR